MKPWSPLWFLTLPTLGVNGCSRDYAPQSDTDAAAMFVAACIECHRPALNGSLLQLSPEHATPAFIQNKIRQGSLLMPAFPRLADAQLERLSHYLLEHAEQLR